VDFDGSGDLLEAEPDERGDCFVAWGWRTPIDVSGSTAFVGRGRQVLAVHLRTGQSPELWAQTALGARVAALRASGSFVYVVAGPPGEQRLVLDASQPDLALPAVGEHDVADWVLGATWRDGTAFRLVQHRRIEVAESR
jgi:hypothetical protein